MVIKAFEASISKGPQLVDHERWFSLAYQCYVLICNISEWIEI